MKITLYIKTNFRLLILALFLFSCDKSNKLAPEPIKEIFPDCKLIEETIEYQGSYYKALYEYENEKLSKISLFIDEEFDKSVFFRYNNYQDIYLLSSEYDTLALYKYQGELLTQIINYSDYPIISYTVLLYYKNKHLRRIINTSSSNRTCYYTTDEKGNVTSSIYGEQKLNYIASNILNPKYFLPPYSPFPFYNIFDSGFYNTNQNDVCMSGDFLLSSMPVDTIPRIVKTEYNENRLPTSINEHTNGEVIPIATYKYDCE